LITKILLFQRIQFFDEKESFSLSHIDNMNGYAYQIFPSVLLSWLLIFFPGSSLVSIRSERLHLPVIKEDKVAKSVSRLHTINKSWRTSVSSNYSRFLFHLKSNFTIFQEIDSFHHSTCQEINSKGRLQEVRKCVGNFYDDHNPMM